MDLNTMEIISEFILFFIQFVFWMFIISFILGLFAKEEVTLDEVNELKDRLAKMIHFVKEEKHGDMLYWFDAHTDAFLGQGPDSVALIESVKARFPTHIFIDETANQYMRAPEWKLKPITELGKESALIDDRQFKI